jgi:hypothetical protein
MGLEGDKYEKLAGFVEYAAMGIIWHLRHAWQDTGDEGVEEWRGSIHKTMGIEIPNDLIERIRRADERDSAYLKPIYKPMWELVNEALDERVIEVARGGDEPAART